MVIASRGGTPQHPEWYRNLVADPNVSIRVATNVYDATARTASPDERGALWQKSPVSKATENFHRILERLMALRR